MELTKIRKKKIHNRIVINTIFFFIPFNVSLHFRKRMKKNCIAIFYLLNFADFKN